MLEKTACRKDTTLLSETVRHRRVPLLLLWFLFLTLSGGSSGLGHGAEPIKIAAIFSETGIAAPHNLPMIDMVQLTVDHLNQHGGVLGRPLQLILLDNGSTPIGSSQAAQKAIAMGVTAVIGAHWSSHSLAIAPLLQEAGIPMISPGSTNPEVTRDRDYVFRVCFIDSFQGLAMAKFAAHELQAKTAAVVTNIDEDYSTTLGRFFATAFQKAGGTVVAEIGYRGTATDFSASINELIAKKPQVVYLPGYTRDSGLFIKQSRKIGLQTIFLGGDAWDEIEKYAGTSIEGSFQSAAWHPQVPFAESEAMNAIFAGNRGKNIENISAPLAYDAVMLLAAAMTRAGSTDRAAIRHALATTADFPGATGPISFGSGGDPHNKAIIVIEFQEGRRLFRNVISPHAGVIP
jgi:branched-chain amino acid transport system substrate-binding protein